MAKLFLQQVVEQAQAQDFTAEEHFTVDGTLLEALGGGKKLSVEGGSGIHRGTMGVMPRSISMWSGGRTRCMHQRRMGRRSWRARDRGKKRS